MKKLPLDTSSFRRLREENYVYVDKTRHIYRMITEGTAYFLSRPRRFGKSLTVSTLMELFKGNRALFKGLWIEKHWKFNEHPVLVFDFNAIDNKNPEVFEHALTYRLKQFASSNSIKINSEAGLVAGFAELCIALYEVTENKPVILIDEYDKPIIDHLGHGDDHLRIAEENRNVQKRLFGVLKDANVVGAVEFVFVTGVSRFSKVSIFSEWNNLNDISQDADFADFPGYNEQELIDNFGDFIELFCKENDLDADECQRQISYWYNGYRFSCSNDVKVYNPVSVLHCLKKREFRNFWFSTATPSFLINLLKEQHYYVPGLDKIKASINFLEDFDLNNLQLEGILYQAGYLTISKPISRRFVELGFPNQEVKESFSEALFSHVVHADNEALILADELGSKLAKGEPEQLHLILDAVFASIPHTLYDGKADEAYFHTVVYLTLALVGYGAISEVLTARGRLDMEVVFTDRVYIFEFKCNQSATAAIRQIREKGYADKWKSDKRQIILVGVDFDMIKRQVNKLVCENY